MTKKSRRPAAPPRTYLLVPKLQFKSTIDNFIQAYKTIPTSPENFKTMADLEAAKNQFLKISSGAEEFIKNAFSTPVNEHTESFRDSGMDSGIIDAIYRVDTHTPQKELQYHQEKVNGRIEFFELLIERLPFLLSNEEEETEAVTPEYFSQEEKLMLNQRLTVINNKFVADQIKHELQLGQEIIFDKIEEVRLMLDQPKKKFVEKVSKILSNLIVEKIFESTVIKWIWETITNQILKIE